MILNVFSMTELFIAFISLVLMLWGGALAFVLASRWKRATTVEERTRVEDSSHLVLLVCVIVLGIRLLNWPFFYATLQSFVPDIDGAMCIFGVTQVERNLTGLAEMIKPVSFFLVGAWLILHMLDQKTETSALMGQKLWFLGVTASIVVADSLLDGIQMLTIAPGTVVSCCTTVTDILERPTRLVPKSVLGPGYKAIAGYGYFVSNGILITALAVFRARMKPGPPAGWRRAGLGFLFTYAIANAALFLLAQIEVHAPCIMNLPFHHCLYCLWQYVPDTILMYALFVLGTCAPGWAFLLDLIGRTGESMDALYAYIRALCNVSVFCLGASMLMNAVHLLIA